MKYNNEDIIYKVAYKYALYLKAGSYGDEDSCMEISKRDFDKMCTDGEVYDCLKKHKLLDKTFVDLRLNASKDLLGDTAYLVLGCSSCCTGSFPSLNCKEELKKLQEFEELQRKKYNGIYVCEYCEAKKENFEEYSKHYLLCSKGFVRNGMILENKGIKNPKSSFLGFAGRWYVIIKNDGTLFISNNMWDKGSLPFIFEKEWKPYINCEMTNFNSLQDLEEILSKEQFEILKKQDDYKKYCEYHKGRKR